MTSAINYQAVNTAFPIAGQDNDSQGFRDNFTAISAALAEAAAELTRLQTNALLAATLSDTPSTVVNDLLGSTIKNGLFVQFNGQYFSGGTIASATNINLDSGPIQKFTLSGNSTLTFTNWPAAGQYAVIRLMLIGDQQSTRTATLATSNAGVFKLATGWSGGNASAPTISLTTNGKYQIIEAWSVDSGTTVFLKNTGEY